MRHALNYLPKAMHCSTGSHGPIGEWDVSRVTDVNSLFFIGKEFNGDISKWDVSLLLLLLLLLLLTRCVLCLIPPYLNAQVTRSVSCSLAKFNVRPNQLPCMYAFRVATRKITTMAATKSRKKQRSVLSPVTGLKKRSYCPQTCATPAYLHR